MKTALQTAAKPSIAVRRSEDRGLTKIDWLESRHSFSFGEYYDPSFPGYRSLRVINDDKIAGGGGFPMHRHRDMEIVTYVVSGAVEHRDSTGGGSTIRPGDVQRMTAGRGIAHSEFNPSPSEPLHLLQIWIEPERRGLEPGYEEKRFDPAERRNRLRLVASPGGAEGSLKIHQDVRIYAAVLERGQSVRHTLAPGRAAWIQVARGALELQDVRLNSGDAAAVENASEIEIRAGEESEFLLFDLA